MNSKTYSREHRETYPDPDRDENGVLVSPYDDEDGICQCKVCQMGYPCGIAHRRFMEGRS